MRPHLTSEIEYVGEVSHGEKVELLQHARATLFPIEWEEPFGLVMIESMACGTPVIATRWGAVPEVIEHGRSGVIVDDWARGRRRARGGRRDLARVVPRLRRGVVRAGADGARLPRRVRDDAGRRCIIRGAVRGFSTLGTFVAVAVTAAVVAVSASGAGSTARLNCQKGTHRHARRLRGRRVAEDPSNFSAIVAKAAFTHDYGTVWSYLNPSLQTAVSQKKWQAARSATRSRRRT